MIKRRRLFRERAELRRKLDLPILEEEVDPLFEQEDGGEEDDNVPLYSSTRVYRFTINNRRVVARYRVQEGHKFMIVEGSSDFTTMCNAANRAYQYSKKFYTDKVYEPIVTKAEFDGIGKKIGDFRVVFLLNPRRDIDLFVSRSRELKRIDPRVRRILRKREKEEQSQLNFSDTVVLKTLEGAVQWTCKALRDGVILNAYPISITTARTSLKVRWAPGHEPTVEESLLFKRIMEARRRRRRRMRLRGM